MSEMLINFWRREGEEDWRVAQSLYRLRHYPQALFFVHLALEKMLKGLVVQETRAHAPYIHDLVALAERAKMSLTMAQRKQFALITTFNISGRYAEEKIAFARRCTRQFAQQQLRIAHDIFLWLKKCYHQTP